MRSQAIFAIVFSVLLASFYAAAFEPESFANLLEQTNAGEIEAQFKVGMAYDSGMGVEANGEKAKYWYLKAAKSGHADAQNSVGSAYHAVGKYKKARARYEKAAAQENAWALNNLVYLYDLGLGVEQDRQRGFQLYSKSAKLGWSHAMWNMANIYGAGQDGKPDLFLTCIWMVRAEKYALPGDKELKQMVEKLFAFLEKQLPIETLERCKKEGTIWEPNNAQPK